ncbi:uncharacterized protein N0V89_004810 [Didymosphaeria variabile]|uniref:Uncharacterized protein n=1 Tax=Didymosphaeria variabile TaxID=1932322 RepID=A0A9W8XQZ5_9PLEO|nr:uncharacterized protein N0V89_004810 [Didymosphaeria variabile]KAJ4356774.1 hypothetical protein N0V89_004810 [Didymosphaeria variabile]
MEKQELRDDPGTKPDKISFHSVYASSQLENFWDGTSDEVKRIVGSAADVQKSDFLTDEVLRKLSRKEKDYLNGSSADELETVLQTYFHRATERQTALKTSQRKAHRAERRTFEFLDNFHNYAEAYSGVIQIMNAAPGGGYGDAAYGALSLFLVVAVNKVKTEELIDQMMQTLHQQYCRIKMVKDVYNTDRMKQHVAVVYRLGIEFLYTAVRYYSKSTFRRWWHVVAQPPSMQLTNKISEIQAAVEEMRKEMEVLDGIRLGNIETKLEETAAQLDRTAKHVQALRTQVDDERLEQLQQLLGVAQNDVDPALQVYADILRQRFDMRKWPPFDVSGTLYSNPDFRAWRKTDDLKLLILRGSTSQPPNTDLSWLSPSAVQLIKDADEIFGDSATLLLRHFCRLIDDWHNRDRKIVAQVIVRSFILQVLRDPRSESFFRNDQAFAKTKRGLESVNKIDEERASEITSQLFGILRGLLETFRIEQLIIVVDRLDEVADNLEVFIDPLLEMIAHNDCRIKVAMTLRTPRDLKEGRMKRVLGTGGYKILEFNQDD